MIPPEVLALFIMTSIALGIAPGPDNIFVLTQSALNGRVAGLMVTFGLCTGLVIHTTAVALGIALLFKTSWAFTSLKLAGSAYLLYLAYQAFKAGASEISGAEIKDISLLKFYGRGIILNITNPKIAIFFLAFLPQFADPSRGSMALQLLILGGIFIASTLLVFGLIACGAGFLSQWLRRSGTGQVIMSRIAGTVYLGLAFRLVATEQ